MKERVTVSAYYEGVFFDRAKKENIQIVNFYNTEDEGLGYDDHPNDYYALTTGSSLAVCSSVLRTSLVK